jgi:nitronate monooxygenase
MKTALPKIILGGMGVNISDWFLARILAMLGQIGIVSGVALDRVMARILQLGGEEARIIIEVLKDFPFPKVAEKIVNKYHNKPHATVQRCTLNPSRESIELIVCANWVWITLAKRDHLGREHGGKVGINYLTKIGPPLPYAVYGAMLARANIITMGAGIPRSTPGIIEAYLKGETATNNIPIVGGKDLEMSFNPCEFFDTKTRILERPKFFPIVSGHTLAMYLVKKLAGKIDCIVIENESAGGHNSPPRNGKNYGEEDKVDIEKIRKLDIPFYLAGSYAHPGKLLEAENLGASGVQIGTALACCAQSGMMASLRDKVCRSIFNGKQVVTTDMVASPTGYPFQVAEVDGTVSDDTTYSNRTRTCIHGVLETLYMVSPDGNELGHRCPSGPINTFHSRGGKIEDAAGKKCLCAGLLETAGLKIEGEESESPIITLGKDLSTVRRLMRNEYSTYSAEDVVRYVLAS